MSQPLTTPYTDPAAQLLRSVVDVARAIFGAAAGSVLLPDESGEHLVFACVSGAGEQLLPGHRFPIGRGIAGWVFASGEPMVADDLSDHALFDRRTAAATGYLPRSLLAAPLLDEDGVLGVLEVLDAAGPARCGLADLDLLALFARQATIALRVVRDARRPAPGWSGPRREAALELLADLQRTLAAH